jgi:hypothetical protein
MKMQKKWVIWIGLLAATLVFARVAYAKGPMPVRITAGGDLWVPFNVTDPEAYAAIDLFTLMDLDTGEVSPPAGLGEGYLMERFWVDEGGARHDFDQAMFFFDPAGGERGWVFYIGIYQGSSEYDGKWFQARAAGTGAMRAILEENGVRFGDSSMAGPPAPAGFTSPVGVTPLVMGAMVALLGISAGVAGQRRSPASD